MGVPLGPTLANAFLCHYEKLWLDSCPPEFKPVRTYSRLILRSTMERCPLSQKLCKSFILMQNT